MRESPALDILALLAKRGAVLSYSDPLVPRLNLDGLELCSELRRHRHGSLVSGLLSLLECSQLIVDTRNRLKGLHSPKIKRL